jgi:hypothetical protein
MAKVKITGHASGSGVITVTAPNTSTDRTITLPDATATVATTTDVAARLPSITDGGNATAMTIDASERVGIGITSGLAVPLSVQADSNASSLRIIGRSDDYGELDFYENDNSTIVSRIQGHNSMFNIRAHNVPINLQQSSANVMTIDTTGAVTMPLQPAFMAQVASAGLANMAINNWTAVAFADERFDQNSDYANNTFTAPVTGKYQLNLQVRTDNLDTAATYYQFRLNTSNRSYNLIKDFGFGDAADVAYWTFNANILADMDANDTVSVDFLQSGGTAQSDITDNAYFSGYLAC